MTKRRGSKYALGSTGQHLRGIIHSGDGMLQRVMMMMMMMVTLEGGSTINELRTYRGEFDSLKSVSRCRCSN